MRAWPASAEPSLLAPTSPNPLRPQGRRGQTLIGSRIGAVLAIAAAALLAGCQQHPARYDGSSEWHRNGANAANLAAMVADPLDLVRGHGDAGSLGAEAAEAVRQWRNGLSTVGAAGTPGSGGPVHVGAGMGAGIGAGAAGGSTTGN